MATSSYVTPPQGDSSTCTCRPAEFTDETCVGLYRLRPGNPESLRGVILGNQNVWPLGIRISPTGAPSFKERDLDLIAKPLQSPHSLPSIPWETGTK